MRSTLPQQCEDAAKVLKDMNQFQSGQGIYLDAAKEIRRLEHIVYNTPEKHETHCECIRCIPF